MSDVASGKTLFVYQFGGPHPAHQPFLDALEADFTHFETNRKPTESRENQNTDSFWDRIRTARAIDSDYDIVIAEGTAAMQTVLWYKLLRNRDSTTILLACDQTFYRMDASKKTLWRGISPALSGLLSGYVSISELVEGWVSPYLPAVPHGIVHPTTTEEKYARLTEVANSTTSSPFTVLSIGRAQPMKNFPVLVEAVERVRKRGVPAELVLVGRDHANQPYAEKEFVTTPGFVDLNEFETWMERTDLYVQTSLGDGFCVAVVEAMLAARPVVVSPLVGAKSLLDDRWVIDPEPGALSESIAEVASIPEAEQVAIGERNRSVAEELSPQRQGRKFMELVERIRQDRRATDTTS